MDWLALLVGWLALLVIGGCILESPYARRRRRMRQLRQAREAWKRLVLK